MGSLLPHNATKLERAAISEIRGTLATDIAVDTLWGADTCPMELLPFLAWALSVDDWDMGWADDTKRNAVRAAVDIHRTKGTTAGIKAALNALDLGIKISEWFEHGGDPYTFKADVVLTTRGLTDAEFENILSVIANTKNARSHLSQLRVFLTAKNANHFAVAWVTGERIDVQPWFADVPIAGPVQNIAAITHIAETVTTGESLV